MIEPPPAEIGLRIGIAIESSKKQQQQAQQQGGLYYQDSSSVKSSESAFYSGGDQTRDTITGEERPSISLPSSSSIGENVWHSERKDEEDGDDEVVVVGGLHEKHEKEKARSGNSSGSTSGPDTPQESFDEDEMQIAKEEEMIRKHLKLGKEKDQDEEGEEGDYDDEENEETKRENAQDETEIDGERKYSVESQELPSTERENKNGEDEYYETEQENDDLFHENLPAQAPGMSSGPGTGTGTPTQVESSRRESTQSMGLSISRKFMDMFSMGELKKLTTSDSGGEEGGSERDKVKRDSTSSSPPEQQQPQSIQEEEGNEERNKMSAMSMSIDDESIAEGGGPGSSLKAGKWGFLKTLKEKKAEEKTNAAAVAQLQADILVISFMPKLYDWYSQ
jgi:hypothetical protein